MMEVLHEAFEALNNYPQFIVYKLSEGDKPNKKLKQPASYKTGLIASALDQQNWTDSKTAIAAANALTQLTGAQYGVGFVFTKDDPFFFIDIDNCYDGKTWSTFALDILGQFKGAAVEVSSSGAGLHIIAKGNPGEHSCRSTIDNANIELYTQDRFVALTGYNAQGDAGIDLTQPLVNLIQKYFTPIVPSVFGSETWWSDQPVPEWSGPDDDEELIRRALAAKSARSRFALHASFEDLWDAKDAILSKSYPTSEGKIVNRSSADAALALHLAFWTGKNAERMLRLMKKSKLYREKWEREDYLPRTIRNACGRCAEVYQDSKRPSFILSDTKHVNPNTAQANAQINESQAKIAQGSTFFGVAEQIQHFNGCIYIMDENGILIPGGYVLDKERFNVMYGGHAMTLDAANTKMANSAWQAFTQSQILRHTKAHSACFKPNLPYGHLVEKDGELLANNYWHIETKRAKGDASLFRKHVEILIPDPRDQIILISYLAALVRYRGVKFQWCPFIQGVDGNGKSYFSHVIRYIIGNRYTQAPRIDQIDSRFNDWQYKCIFAMIEDAFTSENHRHILEVMKPMITNTFAQIEPKGGKKIMREICCNYIINSNHVDGIRKTANDRRYSVFYTRQQEARDLKASGLNADYFENLYNWSIHRDGFAIISEYLHNFEIPDEFNPALSSRAPDTSSTEAAIKNSLGSIEQEIMEAIDQGRLGFRNGWISSYYLDLMLDNIRASRRIPPNRRRELMQSLGYDWHPALPSGRVTAQMPKEGGKPRLYIKDGNPHINLQTCSQIIKAYEEAQKNEV